jgi:hypothetical protein
MHEQRALTHGGDIHAVGSCGGSTAQDIDSLSPKSVPAFGRDSTSASKTGVLVASPLPELETRR